MSPVMTLKDLSCPEPPKNTKLTLIGSSEERTSPPPPVYPLVNETRGRLILLAEKSVPTFSLVRLLNPVDRIPYVRLEGSPDRIPVLFVTLDSGPITFSASPITLILYPFQIGRAHV